jgi:molybdenum cofactor synthesis domain-containing protein
MIDVSKAIRMIDRETAPLGSEKVRLAEAVGRLLREKIIADTDLPPFDRSQMDGYAVVASDTKNAPVILKLVGESAAGRGWHKTLKRGHAIRIMTGAPVPKGADAVQKIELTTEKGDSVEILAPTEKRRFIVREGAEIKKGKTCLRSGEMITENMIATLASFGYAKVTVGRRPRVAILGTGSEIVDIARKPGRDQIRNSNSVMLDVLCRKFGGQASILNMVRDDVQELKSAIRDARSEILVITGGVSVGKYDHTKTALAELGAEIFFDKVRLKPGKPAVFARLGKTLIFGLPGNPVSALVTFHLFVRKAILKMQGAASSDEKKGFAVLASDAQGTRERDTFVPSQLKTDASGRLLATPVKWLGSSDFISYSRADALVFVPRGESLKKGAAASIVLL